MSTLYDSTITADWWSVDSSAEDTTQTESEPSPVFKRTEFKRAAFKFPETKEEENLLCLKWEAEANARINDTRIAVENANRNSAMLDDASKAKLVIAELSAQADAAYAAKFAELGLDAETLAEVQPGNYVDSEGFLLPMV